MTTNTNLFSRLLDGTRKGRSSSHCKANSPAAINGICGSRLRYLWLLLACSVISSHCIHGATVTLAWEPSPSGGVYRLYQSIGSGPFNLASTWAGITATATYDAQLTNRFYVTTYNTNYTTQESPPSNTVMLTPLIPGSPAAPTNLRATQVSGTRFDIGWDSNPIYSTAIERAPPNGAFSVLATVYPGIMHYSTQIKGNESWFFRVKACGSGCGEPGPAILVRR